MSIMNMKNISLYKEQVNYNSRNSRMCSTMFVLVPAARKVMLEEDRPIALLARVTVLLVAAKGVDRHEKYVVDQFWLLQASHIEPLEWRAQMVSQGVVQGPGDADGAGDSHNLEKYSVYLFRKQDGTETHVTNTHGLPNLPDTDILLLGIVVQVGDDVLDQFDRVLGRGL